MATLAALPKAEDVKSAIDTVQFIGQYVELKKKGKDHVGLCCFHSEKTPSFTVYIDGYKCFGCGRSGDVIQFLQEREGLDFEAALSHLADHAGIGRETPKPKRPKQRGPIAKTYDYTDEHGVVLYQSVRLDPKDFYQRRPDGRGGWIDNLGDVRKVPFQLLAVIAAPEAMWTEGEEDALAASSLGFVGTTNAGGVNGWNDSYLDYLSGKTVIISGDNDAPGQKYVAKIAKRIATVAAKVIILTVPVGKDFRDWVNAGATREDVLKAIEAAPVYAGGGKQPFQFKIVSGARICSTDYPDTPWIVDSLIAIGVNLLAGRPKQGKSWMSLQTAIAVAGGRKLFGQYRIARPGRVLYCALEDSERRIHDRLNLLIHEDADVERIDFAFQLPKLTEGGIEALDKQLAAQRYSLLVIDTLVACSSSTRSKDGFRADYSEINQLGDLAKRHKVAILLLHHTRKPFQGSAEEPLDSVLGTTGTTAAADSILVIGKQSEQRLLHVISRDADSRDLAVSFDLESGNGWTVQGEAKQVMMSRERKQIYDLIAQHGAMQPVQVAEMIGKNRNTTRRLLTLMYSEGQIYRSSAGGYQTIPDIVQ